MQGRSAHEHAADVDRFQVRHRGQGTGAPNLDADTIEPCFRTLRREFVRNGPTWRTTRKTHATLPIKAVQFVNHAIDVIGKLRALLVNAVVNRQDFIELMADLAQRIDGKAKGLQLSQHRLLTVRERLADLAQCVGKKPQWSAGGDAHV